MPDTNREILILSKSDLTRDEPDSTFSLSGRIRILTFSNLPEPDIAGYLLCEILPDPDIRPDSGYAIKSNLKIRKNFRK